MSRPDISDLEIAKVNEVLRTSTLSRGPIMETSEKEMANYCRG